MVPFLKLGNDGGYSLGGRAGLGHRVDLFNLGHTDVSVSIRHLGGVSSDSWLYGLVG